MNGGNNMDAGEQLNGNDYRREARNEDIGQDIVTCPREELTLHVLLSFFVKLLRII